MTTTSPRALATLYSQFDEMVEGRGAGGPAWNAHELILDRLTANMREAERRGWSACALERAGGMGRLRAFGVSPAASGRRPIPDWAFESE